MQARNDILISEALNKATTAHSSSPVDPAWGFDHLSNIEFERIRWFLRELQIIVANSPDFQTGFQFLELFLSRPTFPEDIQIRLNKQRPEKETSKINFRLAVSVQMKITAKGYESIKAESNGGLRTSHFQYQGFDEHEDRIQNLESTCNTYLFGQSRINGLSKLDRYEYEFFRYFCVKTIISIIIDGNSYDFESSGIRAFLIRCSDGERVDGKNQTNPVKLETDAFVNLKKYILSSTDQTKEFAENLKSFFETELMKKIPCIDELENIKIKMKSQKVRATKLASAISYMKTLVSQADAIAMQVIRFRRSMPLRCYSVFFGETTNEYPGWIGSFTGPSGFSSTVKSVMPGQVLDAELGKLDKSINYNSYKNYINTFPRTRIDYKAPIRPNDKPDYQKGNKQDGSNPYELGLMIVAPFSLDYGHFQKFGFVRAMRHFKKECQSLYYAEDGDEELEAHKTFMSDLAEHVRHEFDSNFRTETFFSNGGKK